MCLKGRGIPRSFQLVRVTDEGFGGRTGFDFGQLDFAVDALQYCVGNARLDKVNDPRPVRSECVGKLLKGWDFCLLNLSAPVVQKGIRRWLAWHRP